MRNHPHLGRPTPAMPLDSPVLAPARRPPAERRAASALRRFDRLRSACQSAERRYDRLCRDLGAADGSRVVRVLERHEARFVVAHDAMAEAERWASRSLRAMGSEAARCGGNLYVLVRDDDDPDREPRLVVVSKSDAVIV